MSLFQSSFFTAIRETNEPFHNLRTHIFSTNKYLFSRNTQKNFTISCVHNDDQGKSSSFLSQGLKTRRVHPPPNNVVVDGRSATLSVVTSTMEEPVEESNDGIGIHKFMEGKNFFVTGATGFLAKVFVEKILRTTPQVGKILLLIKAKDKESAIKRLKNEIIGSELFKSLKQMHGESYEAFMLRKLIPVVGDMCESDLGMDIDSLEEIAEETDVIVNSAANTTLDERYDISLDANTRATCWLMNMAKNCKNLKLFVHYSTAYANGERQGMIFEKPFSMGESITRERITSDNPLSLFPQLNVDAEVELALKYRNTFEDNEVVPKMKELGLERARLFGWQNTYTFTKAMGEMVIDTTRGEIPIVIIRPSMIESTYSEPFPGWIQGNRVLDPLIISYGKGQLPGYLADPQVHMDVVPADMVVNATIAAIAKHGSERKPEMNVYHVTSAVANPLLICDVFKFSHEHFLDSPFMDSEGRRVNVTGMKYFGSVDNFSSYIWEEMAQQTGLRDGKDLDQKVSRRLEMKCKKKVEHAIHIAKIYDAYMFYKGWFHNGNTQKLMENMSEEEVKEFCIDFGSIDWRNYLLKVHIPGVRKHVMKGRGMSG